MTSDLSTSKYQTMIHEEDANVENNRTIPVIRPNERNYTPVAAGTLPHITPLLGQRGNFPTSLNSFRPNATLTPLKNLSIKDALDCIPKYDGSNIALSTFFFGIREALSMIPEANESDLAKLIKRRLTGEAAKAMEELIFQNINDLIKYFETNFGSYKPHLTLMEELAAARQMRNEKVLTFANRIRRIAIELKEAAKRDKRDDENFARYVEADKLKFFVHGLHCEIKKAHGHSFKHSASCRISNRN